MTTDASAMRVLHHVIGRDGRFVLSIPDGDVRIHGIDGDTVHVRAVDGADPGHLVVERDARRLVLDSGYGSGHHRSGDLLIEVPATAEVIIEGSSADVEVERLAGVQRYRTVSGDLRLNDVRGEISAEAMSGDLDIVADGPLQLDIRTLSGDLDVQAGPIRSLRATTTSGDIRLDGRFAGDGPFTVETVSGDIAIAPAGPVRVDLRTVAGDISSDLPATTEDGAGRRSVVVGSGGPIVDVRTTSGDVRIVATRVAGNRPTPSEPLAPPDPPTPNAQPVNEPIADADPELDVLRALERGEIEIDEARRRLEELDRD